MALKRQPLLWLLVPIFLLAMFIAAFRAGRSVDVIHANWAMTGLISGLAGKLRRKPVVTTLRGTDVSKLAHSWPNRLILRMVLVLNARSIAVSAPMRETLQRLFPHHAKKVIHIPNGVDEQLFSMPWSVPHPGRLRLVSIGNLTPGKCNASILEALQSLPSTVTLTLVGEGLEQKRLTKITQMLGLNERVHFMGAVDPKDIAKVLGRHDALILASHSEGRPNVVVEAMAAGRIILASRLPGTQELIRHQKNGLLFEPGDASAMAQSIETLLENPERASCLAQNARKTIVELGLSWSACAQKYEKLYRSSMP